MMLYKTIFGLDPTLTDLNLGGMPVMYDGVVLDEFGDPLYGVHVINLTDVSVFSTTFDDGRYSILANPDDIIQFSYLGVDKQVKASLLTGQVEIATTIQGGEVVINVPKADDFKSKSYVGVIAVVIAIFLLIKSKIKLW